MNIGELTESGAKRLARARVDSPRLSAALIMGHVLGLDRLGCLLRSNEDAPPEAETAFNHLVARRERGEPLAYVLGKREFYGRNFIVGPGVLVPRPESELLIEMALSLSLRRSFAFADMGTGSACLGLTLALERPDSTGILLDISAQGLEYAARNVRMHASGQMISLVRADMARTPVADATLDLVLANPPYVGLAEKSEVMPCVLGFEPHLALFSGEDGLGHIRALAAESRRILKPGGWLILEHGWQQGPAVRDILICSGFRDPESRQDLAGLNRAMMAQKSQ